MAEQESLQRRDFAMAYMGAIWRSSLTTTQKAICASLVAYANLVDGCPEWDTCRPSRARLAVMAGVSLPTMKRELNRLREMGVLSSRRPPDGKTWFVRLNLSALRALRAPELL